MAVVKINNRPGEALTALLSINGSTAAGAGTQYLLASPMANWGIQVVGLSSTLIVVAEASIATSSDAVFTTVATWASTTLSTSGSGKAVWSTAPSPAMQIRANVTAGASSGGGGCTAWVTGMP